MLCVCVAHVVVKAARDARVAEGQAERAAEARVRAALHTDLLLLLARVAEHGAIATGGDAIHNNNNFFFHAMGPNGPHAWVLGVGPHAGTASDREKPDLT